MSSNWSMTIFELPPNGDGNQLGKLTNKKEDPQGSTLEVPGGTLARTEDWGLPQLEVRPAVGDPVHYDLCGGDRLVMLDGQQSVVRCEWIDHRTTVEAL